MQIWEILLIAVGVSMDAFAVSICKGIESKEKLLKTAAKCGIWFGFFQFLMPVIGFFVGSLFVGLIESVDHWVAFVLLALIGGNMLKEAFSKEGGEEKHANDMSFWKMFVFAIATSVDALAIGITFALLNVNIWLCAGIIGVCTFMFSFVGAFIGKKFGEKYKNKAEIFGGIILILLGIKILIEHLFF